MKYYYALYTDKHTKDKLEQIKKKIEKKQNYYKHLKTI